MATHRSVEDAVANLNRQSFEAENHPPTAAAGLDPILDDEFYIVRARGVLQAKQEMMGEAANDSSGRKRRFNDEDVDIRIYGDAAVVRTCVAVHEPTGEVRGHFWNTKVLVLREGQWKCVAWHVTRKQ